VNYLENNGYTTDADKKRFSKYRTIENTVAGISWATGAIMLAFALLVFTLFIQLTIAACKTEIELLVTLGASPKQLKRFLIKQFFPQNIIIVLVSIAIISLLQYFTAQWLSKLNMFVSSYTSVYTFATAILLLLVLWFVNVRTISKYVFVKR
jgi:cell division protein FtsX